MEIDTPKDEEEKNDEVEVIMESNEELIVKPVVNKEKDAIARERFLRTLLAMQNKDVHFNMYQNTKVSATFQGADSAFEKIALSKLVTPIAVYDTALVRTSDLLSFTVDM